MGDRKDIDSRIDDVEEDGVDIMLWISCRYVW